MTAKCPANVQADAQVTALHISVIGMLLRKAVEVEADLVERVCAPEGE